VKTDLVSDVGSIPTRFRQSPFDSLALTRILAVLAKARHADRLPAFTEGSSLIPYLVRDVYLLL
jgi:hypothetical protein